MTVKYDVLGIGNAIMDVIAPVDDTLLARENIRKSGMTLIDEKRALHLHRVFGAHANGARANLQETAGGSGANTMAGIAALGVRAAYIGKVADDALGAGFTDSMRSIGVETCTLPLSSAVAATARCLIAVTPDGERSMSTFLGANTAFGVNDVDEELVRASAVIYMEGYLFDTDAQKAAFVKAAEVATAAGRQVSLTLSDAFCVDRHRTSFKHLVDNHVDILFANEDELLSLYETKNFGAAISALRASGTLACVTRGEIGSVIIENNTVYEIAIVPVAKVIDTTGAGDLYAAGVLAGRAQGMSWADAGYLGSHCASEIISHYGAKPEKDLPP
ncbi:MAG: adenosine kinase [Robiginitomaculum sp.]